MSATIYASLSNAEAREKIQKMVADLNEARLSDPHSEFGRTTRKMTIRHIWTLDESGKLTRNTIECAFFIPRNVKSHNSDGYWSRTYIRDGYSWDLAKGRVKKFTLGKYGSVVDVTNSSLFGNWFGPGQWFNPNREEFLAVVEAIHSNNFLNSEFVEMALESLREEPGGVKGSVAGACMYLNKAFLCQAYPALTPRFSTHTPLEVGGFLLPIAARALRQSTARDISEQLFGKRRAAKAMVRETGALVCDDSLSISSIASTLGWAYALRGLVPDHWLLDILRGEILSPSPDLGVPSPQDIVSLRRALRKMPPNILKRMVKNFSLEDPEFNGAWMMMTDISVAVEYRERYIQHWFNDRNCSELEPDFFRGLNSFHDLHVALVASVRELSLEKRTLQDASMDTSLPPSKFDGEFEMGSKIVSIASPQTKREVHQWGSEMNHCIGVYADQHEIGRVTLLAVVVDGVMVANIAIEKDRRKSDGYKIAQFYGKNNAFVPDELLGAVNAYFQKFWNFKPWEYAVHEDAPF